MNISKNTLHKRDDVDDKNNNNLEEQSLLPAEQKGCHPGSKVARIS